MLNGQETQRLEEKDKIEFKQKEIFQNLLNIMKKKHDRDRNNGT